MIRLFARRNKLEPTAVCSRLQFAIRKLEIINDIVLHIMFEAKFLSTLERVPYIGQGIWGFGDLRGFLKQDPDTDCCKSANLSINFKTREKRAFRINSKARFDVGETFMYPLKYWIFQKQGFCRAL
ncbi:hypothetical protein HQN89_35180 [Paenibacillus frigoriresistens]|nr:hypothetical protein [Paenibacillus frigoriresistens]